MLNNYLIKHIITLINAPITVCDRDGTMLRMFGGQGISDSAQIFSEDFRRTLIKKTDVNHPLIMQTENSEIFAVLCGSENSEAVIAGPLGSGSVHAHSRFLSGILIMWNMMTGMECTASDIMDASFDTSVKLDESAGDMIFRRQEFSVPHNPYEKEQREQECILSGDVEGLKKCIGETYEGELGTLASSPLRQSKNIAVGAITLASRSAIAGGINPELAFSMADGFIYELEERMNNPITVTNASYSAQLAFAELVHRKHSSAAGNPIIRRAKDYIFRNMHSKISVAEMAGKLHIHPDYLSALFRRCENKTITEYILEEKLNLCKDLLKYSNYTIQEISAYFAFPSQSYFTQKFKKHIGMTPMMYRKMLKHGD